MNKVAINVRTNIAGFGALAFWVKFYKILFWIMIIIDGISMLASFIYGIVYDVTEVIIGSLIGGPILALKDFCFLMFCKLILSYIYDVKQSRIVLERIAQYEFIGKDNADFKKDLAEIISQEKYNDGEPATKIN